MKKFLVTSLLTLCLIGILVAQASLADDMWSSFDTIVSGMESKIDQLQSRTDSQSVEIQDLISEREQLRDLTVKVSSQLSERETKITEQAMQLKQVRKFVWVLGIALAVMWILKIARIILGFWRPEINKLIPLWLDILI